MFSTCFFVGLSWSTESIESIESDVLYVFFRKMWPWKPHETPMKTGVKTPWFLVKEIENRIAGLDEMIRRN